MEAWHCPICEKNYYKTNMARHFKTAKHKMKVQLFELQKKLLETNIEDAKQEVKRI